MKTIQFPLIRITLALISGIILEKFASVKPTVLLVGVSITAVSLSAYYLGSRKQIKTKPWFGLLTFLLFIGVGIGTVQLHDAIRQPTHFCNYIKNSQSIKAVFRLDAPLRSNAKNYRFIATLKSINGTNRSGKVVVSLSKKEKKPDTGAVLAGWAWLSITQKKANPGQFDYSNYLATKHIHGQLFVKKIKVQLKKNYSFRDCAFAIQDQIANNLTPHLGKKELPIVMALLLGQQNEISNAVNTDYQEAGAIHILSVSGLHVGFLVLLLQFCFRHVPNTMPYRWIKLVLTLLVLWSFGCLAGLAPSVLRSVTMFSFVAVGNHLRRSINIYNTLCISAFLILLWEPNYLWDIGFQLSYCALVFIVWLHPLLQQLWRPKLKITQYFWELTTVSIAAQLGTLALSLYYFHQFPGLFLITNWLLLPPLGILLLLGFLLCIFAYANLFWQPLTYSVQWSVEQMNNGIHWIAQQENYIIQDIPMQLPQVILYYILIVTGVQFIRNWKYSNFCWFALTVLALQCNYKRMQHQNINEELVVFDLKKKHFITWKHNQVVDTIGDNNPIKSLEKYLLAIAFEPKKIRKIDNQRIYCKGQKIVVVDKKGLFQQQPVDYIVLIQSPKCHLEHWLETHAVKGVIADGSSGYSIKKLWKQSCKKLKIPFHDTTEKGPYIL